MKFGKKDLLRLNCWGLPFEHSPDELQSRPSAENARAFHAKRRRGRKFRELCERYGISPHTVRCRIKPRDKGGQGMTLRQALREPPRSTSDRCSPDHPWRKESEAFYREHH